MQQEESSIIRKFRIKEFREETPEARTFVLEPLEGWQPKYQPGQFLTLVFYTPHGEKRRSYSICSVPSLHEPLSITVKRIPNGEFSRALIDMAKPGDVLNCSGIGGFFTASEDPPARCYTFLAAGSGITPCFALIKSLLTTTQSDVLLIYSNNSISSTIFFHQLNELVDRYGNRLRIHFLFSDHGDLFHRRLGKWLLDHLLDRYLSNVLPQTRFYLCGPFDYMQMAEIVLRNRVEATQIHKENFSHLPRLILPQPPDDAAHAVTIHLNGKTHTLLVQYPVPITRAARHQGLQLPYSCEAGRCGSCIATCVKGTIWMAYNEVLTDNEVMQGRILTCQSFAVGGDAEISFDEETAI